MKSVKSIHRPGESHWVGDGFPVHTVFSHQDQGADLSPFLLLDHAGPVEFEPTSKERGVGWHPHRGFETVTIAYDGEVEHEDTAGNRGSIGPGDVQWMTAGGGVLHKEVHSRAFAQSGGRFEVLQLWVNLPANTKMTAPRYQTLAARDIPVVNLPRDGGNVRVIAGEHAGVRGPAHTFTPVRLLDVRLRAGHGLELDVDFGHTAAIYVLRGKVVVNGDENANEGELVVFGRDGDSIAIAATSDAVFFVMNGEPIDEPIVGYGPFVMNTPEEIRQAFADFSRGQMGVAPADRPVTA